MKRFILKAIGTMSAGRHLTKNKIYISTSNKIEGIFEDRPFVSLIDDFGKPFSCHLCRFEIIGRKKYRR